MPPPGAGPDAGPTTLLAAARGAGCGCKLPPDILARALAALPPVPLGPDVLVGHAGMDDAAVHRISDDVAVVASIDFFTPVVEDPGLFGEIAATNALSDLYAMGATPLLALAVVMWPRDGDPEALGAVMTGGARVAAEHGCPVLGGHSIDDAEPKYGLSVLGTVHPDAVMTNAAGRPGDRLVLTKPLGVGVAIAAARAGDDAAFAGAVASMLRSNREASAAARSAGVRCATDVTGFGLLGHLREVAAASGVGAWIDPDRVPLLEGVRALAGDGHHTGGGDRNRAALADAVTWDPGVPEPLRTLLSDPQTSGGLLLAVPEGRGDDLILALTAADAGAHEVGVLHAGAPGRIAVGGPRPA
jgi:selenide,water dikinase